ncbi:troponin, partial [Salmonella sp. s54395]
MDPDERSRRREERRQQREEESAAAETNGPTEETEEDLEEEERLKEEAAADKERRRNAEIERQRLEDLQMEEDARNGVPAKPKKKLAMFGRVSKGRKKEILAMLLKKARGDIQLEEKEAALEKMKFIESRMKDTNVESLNRNQLLQLCQELHVQLQLAEGEKFDTEIKVKRRDLQISNLKVKANETRGKFAMPTLKSTRSTEYTK